MTKGYLLFYNYDRTYQNIFVLYHLFNGPGHFHFHPEVLITHLNCLERRLTERLQMSLIDFFLQITNVTNWLFLQIPVGILKKNEARHALLLSKRLFITSFTNFEGIGSFPVIHIGCGYPLFLLWFESYCDFFKYVHR